MRIIILKFIKNVLFISQKQELNSDKLPSIIDTTATIVKESLQKSGAWHGYQAFTNLITLAGINLSDKKADAINKVLFTD